MGGIKRVKGPIRYYCIAVAMDYHSRAVVYLAVCVCAEDREREGFKQKQKGLAKDERRKGITM